MPRKSNGLWLICAHCAKQFSVTPTEYHTRTHCSRECQSRARGPVQKRCSWCNTSITVIRKKLKEHNFCSHDCWSKFRFSDRTLHPRYTGGRGVDRDGYVRVHVEGRGRVHEHRLVMERHLGRRLAHHEVVHHKDHDTSNNEIANLQLLSASKHAELHASEVGWARHYNCCIKCGTTQQRHVARGLCNLCYSRQRDGVTRPYRTDIPL